MGEAGRGVARLGSLADHPEDPSSPPRRTFRAPPNPKAGFGGIVVRRQVLECEPPVRLTNPAKSGSRNRWRDLLLRTSRGDRTPLELFLVGVRGWEAELRRRLMV